MNRVKFIAVLMLFNAGCTTTRNAFNDFIGRPIGPMLQMWGKPDTVTPLDARFTKLTWRLNRISSDSSSPGTAIIVIKKKPEQAEVNAEIKKFIEKGGKLISIGSDAHSSEELGYGMKEIVSFLSKHYGSTIKLLFE